MCSLNLDWSGTDGAFYPYFAIGGNQLCDDVPACVANSEHFHISLDQFYYSFMVTDSQDCDISELYNFTPFQIGNRWQYEGYEFNYDSTWSTGFVESEVIGDTIMSNGLKYYIIDYIPLFGETFARIDSANQILFFYNELYGYYECDNNEWDYIDYSFLDSAYWNDCTNNLADLHTTELFIESLNDTFPSIVVDHWGSETQTIFSKNIGITNVSVSLGGGSVYYKLIAATINGVQYGEYVSISNQENLPNEIVLHPNYPNPFNPTTTIRFSVGRQQAVSLQVFDITGRLIETLIDGKMEPGTHEIIWDAQSYSAGIYFLQMTSGRNRQVQKLILLK